MHNHSPYIRSDPTIHPTELVNTEKRNTEPHAYKQHSCLHGDRSEKTLLPR